MSVVIVGGHDRMVCQYKKICKQYNCKAKVFTCIFVTFSVTSCVCNSSVRLHLYVIRCLMQPVTIHLLSVRSCYAVSIWRMKGFKLEIRSRYFSFLAQHSVKQKKSKFYFIIRTEQFSYNFEPRECHAAHFFADDSISGHLLSIKSSQA